MFDDLFKNKIDAIIIQAPQNRLYFTEYKTTYGYVVLTKNWRHFYTDSRYYESAKHNMLNFIIKPVQPKNAMQCIIADLNEAGVKVVGYEDEFITVADFKKFKKDLEGFTLKPVSDVITEIRKVKNNEQISNIIMAQRIVEKSVAKVMDGVKAGITEKELRIQLVAECIKNGADEMSFDTIVAFGPNTALPHHSPTDAKLEKSDIILVDIGVKYNGYCSDMTRTFIQGDVDSELAQIYDTVLQAQEYALKHIKAGMTCHEADSLAREYIKANGYDAEFSHSLGHGIGIDIHESPRVGENSQDILQAGMVISVEPGIYITGKYGVRIEDMVVVREDGIQNLTEYNKNTIN